PPFRSAARLDAPATDTVPAQPRARPARGTSRADMRTFPTTLRVFRAAGDTDIDRFQETALFPGTPLLLLHRSRDSEWWFAISPLYAGWVHRRHVAEGSAAQV